MRNARTLSFWLLCAPLWGAACLSAFAEDPNPPSIHSNRGAWPIRRQWTPAESQHYAQWVEHLFEMKTKGSVDQRIAKIERMMTDPEMNLLEQPAFLGTGGNPQLPRSFFRSIHSMIDCAKFTAFIPAYYAYRRALPWMTSYVTPERGDIRTSERNFVTGCSSSFSAGSADGYLREVMQGFSSGNYRVNLTGRNSELSDTAPVGISREFLLPGCMNYVDGHCLILAQVTEYGELRFINASMDNTHDIYTYNGMNTVCGITPRGSNADGERDEWDGCFQGLRLLRYPIATTNSSGLVTGVRRRTNAELAPFGFSTEQYDRVLEMYQSHQIEFGGLRPQSLHDYIRLKMKTADRVAPLAFMAEYSDEILAAYQARESFARASWEEVLRHGPIRYPENQPKENIFQAFGRWEEWSSPSSDVDRRNKYFYLADWCDFAIRMYAVMPSFLDLTGLEKYQIATQEDLAKAFVTEKNRLFAERTLTYTKANGEKVTLSLLDIEARLYDLSFDPNHPPELRWGAPAGSAERASAPERATPVPSGSPIPMEEAYRRQVFYRCLGQRETEASFLRNMFVEGFPVRPKFEGQLAKWDGFRDPVLAQTAKP